MMAIISYLLSISLLHAELDRTPFIPAAAIPLTLLPPLAQFRRNILSVPGIGFPLYKDKRRAAFSKLPPSTKQ
jgi:hypothetical protein